MDKAKYITTIILNKYILSIVSVIEHVFIGGEIKMNTIENPYFQWPQYLFICK